MAEYCCINCGDFNSTDIAFLDHFRPYVYSDIWILYTQDSKQKQIRIPRCNFGDTEYLRTILQRHWRTITMDYSMICRDHILSKCAKGSKCRFIHMCRKRNDEFIPMLRTKWSQQASREDIPFDRMSGITHQNGDALLPPLHMGDSVEEGAPKSHEPEKLRQYREGAGSEIQQLQLPADADDADVSNSYVVMSSNNFAAILTEILSQTHDDSQIVDLINNMRQMMTHRVTLLPIPEEDHRDELPQFTDPWKQLVHQCVTVSIKAACNASEQS